MSSHQQARPRDRRRALVRPRWVWGGLLFALAGSVTLGVAIVVWSGMTAAVGTVALGAGALMGWRGGALHDARGAFELDAELRDIKEGKVHEGTKAGDMVRGRAARRESARAERTRLTSTTRALHPRRRGLSVLGAVLLLGGAAFVLATQGLYPHTHTGQSNGLRDLGMAVLVALVGVTVLVSPRRHPLGTGLVLLCAVGTALQAGLAPHDAGVPVGLETAVAVTYVLGGLMALDRRRQG